MKKPDIKSVIILGIGNFARCDDGVGVHVVKYILESGMHIPGYVDLEEAGSAIYDLLPLMTGRKKIVIIDALKIEDIPGTVYRLPSDYLTNKYFNALRVSPELREILIQLYITTGDVEVEIIGIVPSDIESTGISLTDAVQAKLQRAALEAISSASDVKV